MRGFVDGFLRISRLAERSPGFVWRLESPAGHFPFEGDDRTIATLSVWESYEALHAFVYRSAHGGYTARRAQWFEKLEGPTTVMWWIPVGERPTLDEGRARLRHLVRHGPSPRAFGLLRQFDPAGRPLPSRRLATGRLGTG